MPTHLFFNHTDDAQIIDHFFVANGFERLAMPPTLSNGEFQYSVKNNDETETEKTTDSNLLIFVHCTDENPWLRLAEEGNGSVQLVFMSRAGRSRGTRPDNVYDCCYAADRLNDFERAKQFFKELEKGNNRWELLCPQDYPEYLVAAYLLDVAMNMEGHDELKANLKAPYKKIFEEIGKKAEEEFREYGGKEAKWSELDLETRLRTARELLGRVSEQTAD